MITDLLTFLAENKIVLVGACATIGEILVIIINTIRRTKSKKVQTFSRKGSSFLWSANPINLFRKP